MTDGWRDVARAALVQARASGIGIELHSPPGAAGFLGIGWWLAVVGQLQAEFPDVAFDAVLDCGASPGHAVEALRAGVAAVSVEAPPETRRAIAEIAMALGGRLAGTREGGDFAPAPPSGGGE